MPHNKPLVVVTGSSGLLGSRLCARLTGAYTVVGMDNSEPEEPGALARYVYLDLSKDESVAQAFQIVREHFGLNIASVVHLAAYHEMSGDDSPLYQEVSIEGTRRVLRELQGFDATQFVFSSTMLVHAPTEPGRPISEDHPIEPKWPHPKSKVETEEVIKKHRGRIKSVVLRLAGFYDEDCHSIPIAYQIKRILERATTAMVYPGDVSHGESYVHLDDAIDAFIRSIENRHELPEEFVALIGEEDVMSYDERQRLIASLLHGKEGDDWATREIPRPIAKAGAWLEEIGAYDDHDPFTAPFAVDLAGDHFALDTSRARTFLGWTPKHSLRETLPEMVARLKRDPLAWYQENRLEPNEKVREFASNKSWR